MAVYLSKMAATMAGSTLDTDWTQWLVSVSWSPSEQPDWFPVGH